MIKINRGADKSKSLTGKGIQERDKAILYYKRKKILKPFNFQAYKKSDVKKNILIAFNNKCAYCETKFLAVYPGDIEHFRPKGGVIDKVLDPASKKFKNKIRSEKGYYWLAAEWENLLLSCKLCNQEQTYELPGGKSMVLGKKNQFPLKNEKYRLIIPVPDVNKIKDQLAGEERYRLLVDPCKDDPAEYFTYDERDGYIKPLFSSGDKFEKAECSIRVYALQRMPLVLARKEVLLDIQAQQQRILELSDELKKVIDGKDDLSVAKKLFFEKRLDKELRFLNERYLAPDKPYLAMAHYVIGKFLKDFFGIEIKPLA
ncbi:MAG: hypothetical protein QM791_09720 [Ferruginibacter sp.]